MIEYHTLQYPGEAAGVIGDEQGRPILFTDEGELLRHIVHQPVAISGRTCSITKEGLVKALGKNGEVVLDPLLGEDIEKYVVKVADLAN